MKWMEEHHDIEVNYIEEDDVTQDVLLKMLLKVGLKVVFKVFSKTKN